MFDRNPRLKMTLSNGPVSIPINKPADDIQGYSLDAQDEIGQEDVDRLGTKLQSLYEVLPEGEQRAFEALLANLTGP